TTTASSRSTVRWATRRPTTPAPGARRPRPAWPPGSSRPQRTSVPPARPSAEAVVEEVAGRPSRDPRLPSAADVDHAAELLAAVIAPTPLQRADRLSART